MATATISPKFQIVIPKEVRDKLQLVPRQRLQVLEKGGVITLVPDVPLTDSIVLLAANVSLQHGLAMADAVVYATARDQGAQLITGDAISRIFRTWSM